jgi:hypothetical protein
MDSHKNITGKTGGGGDSGRVLQLGTFRLVNLYVVIYTFKFSSVFSLFYPHLLPLIFFSLSFSIPVIIFPCKPCFLDNSQKFNMVK